MLYYFDSSAVIKRYAQETGTAWIKQFFVSSNNNQVYFSQLTSVEVASGLSRKVRTHELSRPDSELALQLFFEDLNNQDYHVVSINDNIVNQAINLTRQYPLRAYDALHLATAQQLNHTLQQANLPILTFVCADSRLLDIARQENLAIENPNLY